MRSKTVWWMMGFLVAAGCPLESRALVQDNLLRHPGIVELVDVTNPADIKIKEEYNSCHESAPSYPKLKAPVLEQLVQTLVREGGVTTEGHGLNTVAYNLKSRIRFLNGIRWNINAVVLQCVEGKKCLSGGDSILFEIYADYGRKPIYFISTWIERDGGVGCTTVGESKNKAEDEGPMDAVKEWIGPAGSAFAQFIEDVVTLTLIRDRDQ